MKNKILLVDDNASLTRLLAILLERLGGYEVRQENRSSSALQTARDFRPQVILLDVDMPGKDGGEVCAEIHRDPLLQDTPVIFVSSLITGCDAGRRNGERYLPKPVDTTVLLRTLRELCPPTAAAA